MDITSPRYRDKPQHNLNSGSAHMCIGITMSESVARDARDQTITVGSYVKYEGTHTRGKVTDIKADGDHKWILLDSTNLFYDSRHLELIDEAAAETEDKEVQSLEEFRKRLEEKREYLETARESFDEPGG